jgi:hypothetical protein
LVSVRFPVFAGGCGVGGRCGCVCRVRSRSAELEHVPVEDVVVREALLVKQVAEQLPEVAGSNKLVIKDEICNTIL